MDNAHGGPLAVALQDLQHIFGERLHALVAYGEPGATPAPSLALVSAISADDLNRCAARVSAWHRAGCATPLMLTRNEFGGSLDAFPIEYGEIIDTHRVIFGADPFTGLAIHVEDLRRACEVQIKSHLVHLRENYLECGGRPAEVAAFVTDSAPSFAQLLRRIARLDGVPVNTSAELIAYASSRTRLDARLVGDLLALAKTGGAAGVDGMKLYPDYLAAVEALWRFVDRWRATAAGQ
jgi:hypothetical protein